MLLLLLLLLLIEKHVLLLLVVRLHPLKRYGLSRQAVHDEVRCSNRGLVIIMVGTEKRCRWKIFVDTIVVRIVADMTW